MAENRFSKVEVVRSDVRGYPLDNGGYFTVRAVSGTKSWLTTFSPEELAQVVSQGTRLLRRPPVPYDGPDGPEHEHCCASCPQSGKWGATGIMPPGHHWHWRNAEHTSGYLAHGHLPASRGSSRRRQGRLLGCDEDHAREVAVALLMRVVADEEAYERVAERRGLLPL